MKQFSHVIVVTTSGKGLYEITSAVEHWAGERAIRHGVAPDGPKLLFMPSQEFQHFNDDDLGALIAYLKSVPPVKFPNPKRSTFARCTRISGRINPAFARNAG